MIKNKVLTCWSIYLPTFLQLLQTAEYHINLNALHCFCHNFCKAPANSRQLHLELSMRRRVLPPLRTRGPSFRPI